MVKSEDEAVAPVTNLKVCRLLIVEEAKLVKEVGVEVPLQVW